MKVIVQVLVTVPAIMAVTTPVWELVRELAKVVVLGPVEVPVQARVQVHVKGYAAFSGYILFKS